MIANLLVQLEKLKSARHWPERTKRVQDWFGGLSTASYWLLSQLREHQGCQERNGPGFWLSC